MTERLTARQVADLLGYHIKHVHRLLRNGDLQGDRFGRTWIIDRSEVEEVLRLRAQHGRWWADHRKPSNPMQES